jgi:hypothetical protein
LIWNTTTSAINQYNGSAWEITYTDTNTQADITGKLNLSGGTMTGNLLTNSSSKIGIGTASPAKSLHVQGNVLIDNPNNGYGGFRIKDDSGGDYNVYLDTGRNQSGTRIWMRHGARVQGTTPWTDATPSNICSFGQGGIAFGSDTAAANTLDDYEEGTWTAAVQTGTATEGNASYTKVGRIVTATLQISAFSDRSSGASINIAGLPFAAISGRHCGSLMSRYVDKSDNQVYVSSTSISIYGNSSGSWSQLLHSDLNNSSSELYISITYQTA